MIYLLRHGETAGSKTRRFIGQTDVALSPRGIDQARFWQGCFADIKIDRIYSSPLSRCVQTARIISGRSHDTDQVVLISEIAEIDLGEWDGRTFRDIKENFPLAWEQRGKDLANYRPPGGESFADLFDRVVPVFHGILRQNAANTLIVAHAGVNRMILCHLLEKGINGMFTIGQTYGCLNIIRRSKFPGAETAVVTACNLAPDLHSLC
jgi:probable phosphoglycerate mutase